MTLFNFKRIICRSEYLMPKFHIKNNVTIEDDTDVSPKYAHSTEIGNLDIMAANIEVGITTLHIGYNTFFMYDVILSSIRGLTIYNRRNNAITENIN